MSLHTTNSFYSRKISTTMLSLYNSLK